MLFYELVMMTVMKMNGMIIFIHIKFVRGCNCNASSILCIMHAESFWHKLHNYST